MVDKACQTSEVPQKVEYEKLQERRKRDIHNICFQELSSLLSQYTATNDGETELLRGIFQSKKFKAKFGKILPKGSGFCESDSKILKSLKKDYDESKNTELSQLIRLLGGKVNDKICIGDSLNNCRLKLKGTFVEDCKSRTETAQRIGRISKFGDERRRLLSIVAWDFSQTDLQAYFACSKKTITAARVHAILFGKGGVPRDGLVFTRQAVSPDVIQEFQSFLLKDDISRPSSCRSVLVDNKETGVRYWQSSVKDVVQQYMMKFPDGVKRTYVYTHLPKNFRTDSMLAGLCNLCDDYGHTNFNALESLIQKLKDESLENHQEMLGAVRNHQKFLKLQYKKQVRVVTCMYHYIKLQC